MRLLPWTGLLNLLVSATLIYCINVNKRIELREHVRELFQHGFDGYMKYAFPADELKSLTCTPHYRSSNPADHGINDIHANVSLTLLDNLSSLPLIHPLVFEQALEDVSVNISFDQDYKIQVFELTIRALGGLLSAYQYLDDLPDDVIGQEKTLFKSLDGASSGHRAHKRGSSRNLKRYQPRLLELAKDLGERLLPAFGTATGIPYARVNLRRGLENGETVETCTAGAGSLVLEFTVLSRLTGDNRYETVARKAYLALWNRRSPHNLVGNTIGATHGLWLSPGMSGTGAGIDSFFEYGMKAAIMMDDDSYLDIFQDAYAAIQTHIRTHDGFIYRPVQLRLLHPSATSAIDSLAAFFPGLQVLAGDVESAIRGHLVYWNLWRRYSAIPESFVWSERRTEWAGYPGRPEFIESTYYLYQATKDPFYLRVGERVLRDIETRLKTECGFATLKNVETDEREDRMESFVLSETLKYLYLLFDPSPSSPPTNKVFTTEGHPLYLPRHLLQPPSPTHQPSHLGEDLFCPVYTPPRLGGLVVGIEKRRDYEYARSLIFGPGVDGRVEERGQVGWWEGGYCEVPKAPKYAFDVLLAPPNQSPDSPIPEDTSPSLEKVYQDLASGDFVIANVEGLKLGVRWRLDGTGYDVSSIGPHRVRPGQQVIITDPKMEGYLPVPTPRGMAEVMLRFSYLEYPKNNSMSSHTEQERKTFLHAVGATATFGRAFTPSRKPRKGHGHEATSHNGKGFPSKHDSQIPFQARSHFSSFNLGGGPVRLLRSQLNPSGCQSFPPYHFTKSFSHSSTSSDSFVVLLDRGDCTFVEKLYNAIQAGAQGVIVTPPNPPKQPNSENTIPGSSEKYEEGLLRPSGDSEDIKGLEGLNHGGMIYVDYAIGGMLKIAIEVAEFGVSGGIGGKFGQDVNDDEEPMEREVFVEVLPLGEGDDDDDMSRGTATQNEGTSSSSDTSSNMRNHRQSQSQSNPNKNKIKEILPRGAAKIDWDQNEQNTGADGRGREGRVMVADWVVWNLRVVENA